MNDPMTSLDIAQRPQTHTCTACDTPAARHRNRCDHIVCRDPEGGLPALHTEPLCCPGCLCGRYLRAHTPPDTGHGTVVVR